jgi:hypothetical protein
VKHVDEEEQHGLYRCYRRIVSGVVLDLPPMFRRFKEGIGKPPTKIAWIHQQHHARK